MFHNERSLDSILAILYEYISFSDAPEARRTGPNKESATSNFSEEVKFYGFQPCLSTMAFSDYKIVDFFRRFSLTYIHSEVIDPEVGVIKKPIKSFLYSSLSRLCCVYSYSQISKMNKWILADVF
jgi:hypothetical protein